VWKLHSFRYEAQRNSGRSGAGQNRIGNKHLEGLAYHLPVVGGIMTAHALTFIPLAGSNTPPQAAGYFIYQSGRANKMLKAPDNTRAW
jgi:hypothetical protein